MSYLTDKSLSIKLFTYLLNDMYFVFPNSSSFASFGNSIRTFICFVSTSFIGRPRPCFSIHANIVKYYQLLQCEIIYYYLVFLICINDLLYYLYIIKQQLKNKSMTTQNINNLKVGDKIQFVNLANANVTIEISRVEEKSVYGVNGNRESWSTINKYIKKYNALIIRA